jgi:predicted amidohydrolase YtcJ
MEMAQRLWGSRCSTAYAWRTLQEASAVLAFGSDAPVEALNPWLGIHAAVTRQRPDGTPPQGWYPEQRLSVGSAIWGFTTGTAIAAGCAHEQGTLMPGMLADMVVLPYDPFQIRPAELPTVTADITILEGEVVWEKER